MMLKKFFLTRHERRCAKKFQDTALPPPWDDLYDMLPFDLMEMAERGEPRAAYVMGDMLDQGMGGLDRNFEKALIYYRLGEQQGDAHAINNIGSMHYQGEGLPKDLYLARQYFEKAVEIGDCPAAMNNLGRMYLDGLGGLSVDVPRGLALLERGARLHDINAALKLQSIYQDGDYRQGKNEFKRIYWLWQAAYNGSGWAFAEIADYLREGIVVFRQRKRVRALYRRGALLEDSYATLQFGVHLMSHKYGPPDFDAALYQMTKAESMGETFATECIAKLKKIQEDA